ncbi:MAG: rRNA maturation RNase YbeY [Pseudomonadota bacterium]
MTLSIDLKIDAGLWPDEAELLGWLNAAVEAAQAELLAPLPPGEIAILLTDDQTMRAINREHRGIDKPTNVLSFPTYPANIIPTLRADRPHLFGDLVFAEETIASEALAADRSRHHHMSHLIVHGFLHLLGYDHESDGEAETMEALEKRVLCRLGIADPYSVGSEAGA